MARRSVASIGAAAIVLLLGACLQPALVDCNAVLCPHDLVCDATAGCIYREQRTTCASADDGAACAYPHVEEGVCHAALCVPAICGDDVMRPNEACDDGNNFNNDGCSADCSSDETCGNGVVDALQGELCDAGSANSNLPDAPCRTNCKPTRCGDLVLDSQEACDDGNHANGDGCSEDCTSNEQCGNGVIDPTELCDAGAANSDAPDAACRLDCRPQRCGDAILDTGEDCDSTNLDGKDCTDFEFYVAAGLACSHCSFSIAGCSGECGDGVRDLTEACDGMDFTVKDKPDTTCEELGYHPPPGGVTLACVGGCLPNTALCGGRCGDGVIDSGETCDTSTFGEDPDCFARGSQVSGTVVCNADCTEDTSPCDCGDGNCGANESYGESHFCAADCAPTPDNNVCEGGEQYTELYFNQNDCGPHCPDGLCEQYEGAGEPFECPDDCP